MRARLLPRQSPVPTSLGVALALAALLAGGGAQAAGGVVEINAARASAGGVTPGDAAGYPVRLSASGNYALTGNLEVTSQVTVIEVAADDVSIDLHGFALLGPVTCTGEPVTTCDVAAAGGYGIDAASRSRVVVRNGHVHGMGAGGIRLGDDGRVSDVNASSSFGPGIAAGQRSVVEGCIADQNALEGIDVGPGGVIRRSVAVANGQAGLRGGAGSLISSSSSVRNGRGIFAGDGATVLRNASALNTVFGLEVGSLDGRTGFGFNVFHCNGSDVQTLIGQIPGASNLLVSGTFCP